MDVTAEDVRRVSVWVKVLAGIGCVACIIIGFVALVMSAEDDTNVVFLGQTYASSGLLVSVGFGYWVYAVLYFISGFFIGTLIDGLVSLMESNARLEKALARSLENSNEKIAWLLGKKAFSNSKATQNESQQQPCGAEKSAKTEIERHESAKNEMCCTCARCNRECKVVVRAMLEDGTFDMVCKECFDELSR